MVAGVGEAGLGPAAAHGVQDLIGHAVRLQDGHILGDAIELLLRAEELQGALAPLVIGDGRFGAQGHQAVEAVIRQAHHAALVERVPGLGAVAQHRDEPADRRRVQLGAQDQRRVLHEEPGQGLAGMPGAAQGEA